MKGKAELILTDPDSGRVVKRIEESNMVTNAVKRIFDIPRQAILKGNTTEMFNGFMPVYKYLMGGLVMLGNTMEENPDKFMIPADSTFVGCAGKEYTGTMRERGTLNKTESGEIDGGYRFVWDFAPEKAVGTIRCIGLTNLHFGNGGFTCTRQDGSLLVNPQALASKENGARVEYFRPRGRILGRFDGGQTLYTAWAYGKKLTIYRLRVPDYNGLKANESISTFNNMEVIRKDEYQLPFNMNDFRHFAYDKATSLVYVFNSEYNSSKKIWTVKYVAVDPKTVELKRKGTFEWAPLSYSSTVYYGVNADRIYITSNNEIKVFNLNGENIESYDAGDARYSIPLFLGGKIGALVVDNSTNCTFYTYFDREPKIYLQSPQMMQTTEFVNLPYVLAYNFDTYEINPYIIMLRTDYLATINNLAEPLVKTDRHALQVRYEITAE